MLYKKAGKLRRIGSSVIVALLFLSLFVYALNAQPIRVELGTTMTSSSTVIGVNQTAGLELIMQLEKTEYRQLEPVNITFTLTNISNHTITLGMAAWSFDFLVINGTNHVVFQYSTSQIFPMWVAEVSIDPGENLTIVEVWPGTCNTTTGLPASLGTYYIIGQFYTAVGIESILVRTPPLRITLVPPFTVVISPVSATLDAGQSETFFSSVSGGTGPYSYQWCINGTLVSDATDSSLNFSKPAGSYAVYLNVTDNTDTIAISNIAHVVVTALGTINIAPSGGGGGDGRAYLR
jgi:hypothetical protein